MTLIWIDRLTTLGNLLATEFTSNSPASAKYISVIYLAQVTDTACANIDVNLNLSFINISLTLPLSIK